MERKTMPNQVELQEEVVLGDRDELLLFRLNWIPSPKAEQYRNGARNQRLLEIAKEIMPDL